MSFIRGRRSVDPVVPILLEHSFVLNYGYGNSFSGRLTEAEKHRQFAARDTRKKQLLEWFYTAGGRKLC